MPLQKQAIPISFGQGLDTKTDPYQVGIGKFLLLENSVFNTVGRLTKRNGFSNITTLPNKLQTNLMTLNDNLLATGSNLYALSQDTNQWLNQGVVQPVQLSTLPLVRANTSQSSPDSAVSNAGLVCLAYVDTGIAYYQVSDSSTGQQIVKRTSLLSIDTTASVIALPRVFLLGNYFIITYLATVGGNPQFRYIALSALMPTNTPGAAIISSNVLSISAGYDASVSTGSNNLYLAWAGTSNTVQITFMTSGFVVNTPVVITGHTSTLMSVSVDEYSATNPVIYVSFWDSGTTNASMASFSQTLVPLLTATQFITGEVLAELTSLVSNGLVTFLYEVDNSYASPYPTSSIKTDYIVRNTVTSTGTVGTRTVILRSVGLASKAFVNYTYTLNSAPTVQLSGPSLPVNSTFLSSTIYTIATYGEINTDNNSGTVDQPTYFLIDSTGMIYMRLAYSNGGGYQPTQVLSSVNFYAGEWYTPYQYADQLVTVNKNTATGIPNNSIYFNTGINLAIFSINVEGQYSSEIAGSLFLTGGQLWQYDGVRPVEQGFQVWPDNVAAVWSTTGGNIVAQPSGYVAGQNPYYYQFCYEWTDGQGNIQRSAPSIPLSIPTTGSGTTGSITLYVPTLRLTSKISPNPVRIVGYRWSVAQQIYYQFTSVTTPTLNDPTVDFVMIIDTQADASILGNAIIYTTGGVVEDIAGPPSVHSALFNNRLFLIDAEDRNLLWFSKQVIEAVPVEMSDLLTLYVAPTTGAQGSTGSMTALAAMDDKLIIFKKDAIYYINGVGPDNTGANSTYSDAVFITAAVGCSNPSSIVLMPAGLMFQSDKGIWLLGRDLSTNYTGAGVEAYNSNTVVSAQSIPATNQVRFVLNNSVTLMYDYYMQQWGTFSNISAISGTLWQSYQTYLNNYGEVFQETPGSYLDGATPVLMNFMTSWINIAGLQGFERFYFANLLGTYDSPFKLAFGIAYDYNASTVQQTLVTPDNQTPNWGGLAVWGANGGWGGPGNVFTARIFPQKQKCQSFQVSIQELYDPSFNQPAGAGLTLSGLALIVGMKKGYRTQSASKSFG